MDGQWAPATDGKNVWVVNTKTGATKPHLRTEEWKVVGVSMAGAEVIIAFENGRVRAWNPDTGSSRLFMR